MSVNEIIFLITSCLAKFSLNRFPNILQSTNPNKSVNMLCDEPTASTTRTGRYARAIVAAKLPA